ncbi:tyrosine-type recombinase/integrase [Actinoalloteichus caeruleus]|uniref:tyrosine-type recombinase/integrase n=1 Tax=Actinoalloteichus cyanogriseus TaxID=2893586 RepID=UPI003BB955A5
MAYIEDRWWNEVPDPAHPQEITRVRSERHGKGLRYRVRYYAPDGRRRAKSFPDRQKRAAEKFMISVQNQMNTGDYIAPDAGAITVREYAERWLDSQTFEESTRASVRSRLTHQIFPQLGSRSLTSLRPSDIRGWVKWMQDKQLATSYQAACFSHLSSVFNAALDDGRIRKNPCLAATVSRPRPTRPRITPWSAERVSATRDALPERFRLFVALGAGCGLRQGECFGLSPDDIDRQTMTLHVRRQVRTVSGVQTFALPKGGKIRQVPLPESVLTALDDHLWAFSAHLVTLPWARSDGRPETVRLMLTHENARALHRSWFDLVWDRARRAAGVAKPTRQDGTHALRHYYASVLLDAGESVKALSEYLGHHDPAFTLRTYTHLLPNSHDRTRQAVDAAFAAHQRRDDVSA